MAPMMRSTASAAINDVTHGQRRTQTARKVRRPGTFMSWAAAMEDSGFTSRQYHTQYEFILGMF
jgi:hypothetical protein